MPTNEELEANRRHLEEVDLAQEGRLLKMFEELEDCNIEHLSDFSEKS